MSCVLIIHMRCFLFDVSKFNAQNRAHKSTATNFVYTRLLSFKCFEETILYVLVCFTPSHNWWLCIFNELNNWAKGSNFVWVSNFLMRLIRVIFHRARLFRIQHFCCQNTSNWKCFLFPRIVSNRNDSWKLKNDIFRTSCTTAQNRDILNENQWIDSRFKLCYTQHMTWKCILSLFRSIFFVAFYIIAFALLLCHCNYLSKVIYCSTFINISIQFKHNSSFWFLLTHCTNCWVTIQICR